MPVTVRCPGCNAAMKVKDELIGRRVKCPKCAEVISVPESNSAADARGNPSPSAARRPAATAEARESESAAPKPRATPKRETSPRETSGPRAVNESPAPSFDDLDVPPNFREKVEAEIGDEPIVWMGRPDPEVLMKKAKWGSSPAPLCVP